MKYNKSKARRVKTQLSKLAKKLKIPAAQAEVLIETHFDNAYQNFDEFEKTLLAIQAGKF